jgi:hypothetical protein
MNESSASFVELSCFKVVWKGGLGGLRAFDRECGQIKFHLNFIT